MFPFYLKSQNSNVQEKTKEPKFVFSTLEKVFLQNTRVPMKPLKFDLDTETLTLRNKVVRKLKNLYPSMGPSFVHKINGDKTFLQYREFFKENMRIRG